MSDLIWAVKNGDLDKVKEIVAVEGYDLNAQMDGRSPCHFAADYGQLEVLQYLIGRGADPEAKDKHGISVLLAAVWEGHTNCVKFLIEKGCSKTGTAPDGTSYLDSAEKDEIKSLLKWWDGCMDDSLNSLRQYQDYLCHVIVVVSQETAFFHYIIIPDRFDRTSCDKNRTKN